MAEIDEKHC